MADFYKKIMAAFFAALTLAACSKDLPETAAPEKTYGPYTFLIGESTKTILGSDERGRFAQWESGDRVGTLVSSGGTTVSGYANVTPGTPASFRLYKEGGFKAGDVVRSYYPYTSATSSLQNVKMSIPAVQAQNGAVFDFDAMPLVSTPYEITQDITENFNPVGEIYFANLAAIAEFNVYSTNAAYAGETINSIKFEASAPLAGSFSIDLSGTDLSNPETLVIDGYSDSAVTTVLDPGVDVPSSQSSAVSVLMVLAPGTYDGTVVVTTDAAVYRYPLKSSQTFKRSVIRSFGVDLGTCADRSTMEVPITVTKSLKQILQSMGMGSISNGTKVEILNVDDVVSIETNGYNNCGKVYGTASQWRVYAADYGNIKIKVAPGYELRSITLTYTKNNSGTTTPSFDGPVSNSATTVSGCSVTYHVGNNLGNVQFTNFSITYVESSYSVPRVFLDCYEMPSVDVTIMSHGNETFVDDYGSGEWFGFDLPDLSRRIITHSFIRGGNTYRNYTSMMDRDKRCALWVAYPMHGVAYANNNAGRDIDFYEKKSYDPAIPASWQSSGSTSDYNGGNGYSRGHLCASEDRQVSKASNYQTFYYTNQAPQWQNGFNSGVWSSLESAVQNKASTLTGRDTLYVVSGTLFEDGNTGSSNDGGTVARPSHFYKLLMLCSFNSSGTMTSAKGSAYLYTNESHTGANYDGSNFKKSIDDIETLTGFDFFANVPQSLQDTAEATFQSIL